MEYQIIFNVLRNWHILSSRVKGTYLNFPRTSYYRDGIMTGTRIFDPSKNRYRPANSGPVICRIIWLITTTVLLRYFAPPITLPALLNTPGFRWPSKYFPTRPPSTKRRSSPRPWWKEANFTARLVVKVLTVGYLRAIDCFWVRSPASYRKATMRLVDRNWAMWSMRNIRPPWKSRTSRNWRFANCSGGYGVVFFVLKLDSLLLSCYCASGLGVCDHRICIHSIM